MLQSMMDTINETNKNTRSRYHVTLGQLIEKLTELSKQKPAVRVVSDSIDVIGLSNPHSYRGYYTDLSLEPCQEITTANDLLKKLKKIVGKTKTGYKGGDFLMADDTPLWISYYGRASEQAIISMETYKDGPRTILNLVTKNV